MKRIYTDVAATQGFYAAGIYKIQLVPREWINTPIVANFNTWKVDNAVDLKAGYSFIELAAVPDSYEFDEKPKSNRGGSYFEVSIQATINEITPDLLPVLETLRYHELVAILYDKRRRKKIVGDQDAGLTFRFANKEDSTKQGGVQPISIDLTMDSDKAAFFYLN